MHVLFVGRVKDDVPYRMQPREDLAAIAQMQHDAIRKPFHPFTTSLYR